MPKKYIVEVKEDDDYGVLAGALAIIMFLVWVFIKFAPWILGIGAACLFGIGGKKFMEVTMPKSSESSWQSLLALMLALVAGFIGYSKGLDIQKKYPLDSPPAREKKVEKSNTSPLKSPEPPKDTYQPDNSTSKDSQPEREKAVLDGKDFNQERESEDAHGSGANTYPPIDAQIHQAPSLPSLPSDASEDASKDSPEFNH